MRKLGVIFVGLVAVAILSACTGSDNKEGVLGVHEDFHKIVEGVGNEFEDTPQIVKSLEEGSITKGEFDELKEDRLEYVAKIKEDLKEIKEPRNSTAKEYYDKSYGVIDKTLETVETTLDVPKLDDKEGIEEYNQLERENEDELEFAMRDLEEYQEKLSEKDSDYKDAFKIK